MSVPVGVESGLEDGFAVSPDGRYIAMLARSVDDDAAARQLWLRPLNSRDAILIRGTEGANRPFWSPDSRSIGFVAPDHALKRVNIDGTPPRTILPANTVSTASAWSPYGIILFTNRESGLSQAGQYLEAGDAPYAIVLNGFERLGQRVPTQ